MLQLLASSESLLRLLANARSVGVLLNTLQTGRIEGNKNSSNSTPDAELSESVSEASERLLKGSRLET